MKACLTLHAETGICVFLNWENGIWVTGTGMKAPKIGMGKSNYHYKDSCCSWTFQSEITLRTATEQFLMENLYYKN